MVQLSLYGTVVVVVVVFARILICLWFSYLSMVQLLLLGYLPLYGTIVVARLPTSLW